MVNPTGYTALDFIGFTDKGTYAANVNYVKNDLVHYGGNIWRVLVDDTIGITPAEGTSYTLFIGEPTNLVERIIAPLEENPATIAYGVGRQIIYNNYLYEVVKNIAVGDILVAYEDDPTNANIKLASPVETQVLALNASKVNKNDVVNNVTTTTAGKVLDARQGKVLQDAINTKINKSDIANNVTTTAEGKVLDARQGKALQEAIEEGITDIYQITTPSFSSLPQTYTAQGITANHELVQDGYALLSNPSAQGSDWTITTGANTITISGTFSGSTATTVKMTLGIKRSLTVS